MVIDKNQTRCSIETCSRIYGNAGMRIYSSFYISQLLSAVHKCERPPVSALTDSESLFEISSTTKSVQDRRLRIEISAIREMCERKEIQLLWVDSKNQLSDVLTKKGATSNNLMKTVQSGRIHRVMFTQAK